MPMNPLSTKKICIFVFIYLLIWTLAPTLLASSVALDVSEGINWGSEWQWGYYKHPPFSSWVLYSFYVFFAKLGMGAFGVYLLSQICVGITLFCNYQLAKTAWSQQVAILASILTMGVFYYTYPTLEFNHNIAQFPIWSGLALAFYLAVTHNKWSHWLWVAVLGGVGMLTKYSVIFLLLPMALYLIYPKNWQLLKSTKAWVSAALMLAIFAPHFYWLMTNDWLPLSYAEGRGHNTSWFASHFSWVGFSTTQLLIHTPLLIIAILQRKNLQNIASYWQNLKQQQKLIAYLWLAPLLVLWAMSLLFGVKLRDMWGMPMWGLSAVMVASLVLPNKLEVATKKMSKGIAIWLTIISTLMVVYVGFGHKLRDKPSRMDWSEQALAQQANQTWQQYSNCPLDSLAGDRWLTALVALHSQSADGGFPSQVFEGSANKSPWMTTQRLANGTMVLWQADKPEPQMELFGQQAFKQAVAPSMNKQSGQWLIPWDSNPTAEPLAVNWTIYVPVACANTDTNTYTKATQH